jgi:hypothetical protein
MVLNGNESMAVCMAYDAMETIDDVLSVGPVDELILSIIRKIRNYAQDVVLEDGDLLNSFSDGMTNEYVLDYMGSLYYWLGILKAEMRFKEEKNCFRNMAIDLSKEDELMKINKRAAGIKGMDSRHSKKRELKKFAIDAYNAKKWHSKHEAALALEPKIRKKAEELGLSYAEERGVATFYGWFLKL